MTCIVGWLPLALGSDGTSVHLMVAKGRLVLVPSAPVTDIALSPVQYQAIARLNVPC